MSPFDADILDLTKTDSGGKKESYNGHVREERTKESQRSQRRLSHWPYFEPGNGRGVELLGEEVPAGKPGSISCPSAPKAERKPFILGPFYF